MALVGEPRLYELYMCITSKLCFQPTCYTALCVLVSLDAEFLVRIVPECWGRRAGKSEILVVHQSRNNSENEHVFFASNQ